MKQKGLFVDNVKEGDLHYDEYRDNWSPVWKGYGFSVFRLGKDLICGSGPYKERKIEQRVKDGKVYYNLLE